MYVYNSYLTNEEYDELTPAELSSYLKSLPKVHVYALCEGRHEMPKIIDGSIFPGTVDPTDISGLKRIANEAIPTDCAHLLVYVTGLTSAMLTVISICVDRGISLTAMHYNRETGKYYPQVVTTFAGEFPVPV